MSAVTRFEVACGAAKLLGEQIGDGPNLLLLHAGVADRRMYHEVVPRLADAFTVTAYDRRGFGETTTADEPFSHVDDLRAVIEARALADPVLVGCSMGGGLAIDYALAEPTRVRALVLIASAVSGQPEVTYTADIAALEQALADADAAGDIDRVNQIEAHVWLDGPRSIEGRVGDPLRSLFLDMNGIALRQPELTRERAPTAAWSRLGELDVPALLIHGTLDYPDVIDCHEHLATTLPRARAVVVPDVAHMVPMERPELVATHIREFMATVAR